ncbi:uncharacterized protein LOC109918301 [Rhincodon typus]|uniref:uncharacterized protein LOC109918301 n=1 Tax=Rhincodon typus TaxID=259920 RepID=UPI002030A564|nr:uncharacterized protein LOC109918301 [Rhincodon typus]
MPHRCLVQGYKNSTVKNCFISGKTFYLDLPNNKNSKYLEDIVKKLGGTIESFLSKEVSYVISNSREAKLRNSSVNLAPVPNREHLKNNPIGTPQSVNPKDGQMMQISRGKQLLETVIKNNECGGSNSILVNARSWGVKILHLDDLLAYFEKRGVKLLHGNRKTEGNGCLPKPICKNTKVRKLKQPFLKIEDSSRHFRPLYQQYTSYPELNYESHRGFSAFDPLKKPGNAHQEQEKNKLGDCRMTNSEGDVETLTKPAAMHTEKKQQRFCECCRETFYDLVGHLLSKQHQDFASDSSQFAALDDIMSQLENEFVQYQSDGYTQRSMKFASSCGISRSKMYTKSMQAVNDFVLGEDKCSLESMAASQQINFPVKNLERIEENDQNSKVYHVIPDKTTDELTQERLKLNGHRSCSLQQDHDLVSLSSLSQITACPKQLEVKPPDCILLDFNTGVSAERTTSYVPNEQTDVGVGFVQKKPCGGDKDEISDEQEHVKYTSVEASYCVEAIPDSWKAACDIITTDTNFSFKKRKRSDNTSSQIERSPRCRLDALTNVCDCFSFPKSGNCLARNFNAHIFRPHNELLYSSNLDKTFTSHSCVEKNMFPSVCSLNISVGEHFDLTGNSSLHRPLTSKEILVNLQSSRAKGECENWEKSQTVILDSEVKLSNLANTTSTAGEVDRPKEVLHSKEQIAIPLSSVMIQAEKDLLSASQNNQVVFDVEAEIHNTNEEIEHSNVAGNTAMQLLSSFKSNGQKSLGFDAVLCTKADLRVDESRYKNSVNETNFHQSSFKNNIFHTDSFSSESEWDIQLPSRIDNRQIKDKSVDLELLRKTCVSMKDAKYETQLYSVLKDKAEVDWTRKEERCLMSCQTETRPPCYLTLLPYLDSYTN